MVRLIIIGIVIAVAFTLYALVDAAMSDSSRARGVPKPVWVVLIVMLPVIGAALWFFIGKGSENEVVRTAPDDDPRFTAKTLSEMELDEHLRDLEMRLQELDDEVYPGEAGGSEAGPDDVNLNDSEARHTDVSHTEASGAESSKSESKRAEPNRTEPNRTEPGNTESGSAEAEPGERPESDRS